MQDRFNNNNNKKGFDLGKAWRDVKTAYIVNLAIVLTVVLAILITMFVVIPSRNESHQEGREEGRELGLAAGYKVGYKKIQEQIILHLLLAGFDESDVKRLTGCIGVATDIDDKPDTWFHGGCDSIDSIKDELKIMSDKQIIELKNLDVTDLNRLRDLAKKYNPNQEEAKDHKLYLNGIIEGKERRQKEIAANMLLAGLKDQIISTLTKVRGDSLSEMKSEIKNMTDKQLEEYLADDTWKKKLGRYASYRDGNVVRIENIKEARKLNDLNEIENWKIIADEKDSADKK